MNVWKYDRKLFICSLLWQNCNFAIVLHSWCKFGRILSIVYYFSAECQGLQSIWFCALQYFLSPILFHSLILPFFYIAGMMQEERHLTVMQPYLVNIHSRSLLGGKGLWLWLLARKSEEVPFSCLLELWLLPSVQGRGVAQGLKMCMAQLAWCAGFTPPSTQPAASSLHHCVVVLWRDGFSWLLFWLVPDHSLHSAEAPGEYCSNRSKTATLTFSSSPFPVQNTAFRMHSICSLPPLSQRALSEDICSV